MAEELTWTAPGDGDWWLVREHFPYPVSGLFATLFPPVTLGWKTGAARYGLATGTSSWAPVNGWIYFGPRGSLTAEELAERDAVAADTLDGATPWRDEVRRWHEEERPAAIAANLSLQAVDVTLLDDVLLSAHLQRTIENFRRWAPIHFEHTAFDIAAGLLIREAARWDIDGHEIIEILAGGSPASAGIDTHLRHVADALDDAGAPLPVRSLDEIRAAGPHVARALDTFLAEYRHRPVAGHDVLDPTVGERPELIVASVDVRRRNRPDTAAGTASAIAAIRARVPETDRERFDEMLVDTRAAYGLRDDDVGICWNWPLGLIRHAGLEVGRRLAAEAVIELDADVFEASVDELPSLLAGRGPSPATLADRRDTRVRAALVDPPTHLAGGGEPEAAGPPHPANVAALESIRNPVWSVATPRVDAPLHGIGIGSTGAVGPARLVREPEDLVKVVEGDILVAVATTTAFNAVFALLAGVVTEQGNLLSHAAILSRELGVPAVVGIGDLFQLVHDGDVLEIDPSVGSVRVVDRPGSPVSG